MPGDWLMYRHLEDRQKCPECDQRMELVKTVSFVGAIASENKEVFRCNNCHKDVEQTPVLHGTSSSSPACGGVSAGSDSQGAPSP